MIPIRIILTKKGGHLGSFFDIYTDSDDFAAPDPEYGVKVHESEFDPPGYLFWAPDDATVIRVCNHYKDLCDVCVDLTDCFPIPTTEPSTLPPTTLPPTTEQPTTKEPTTEPPEDIPTLWICGGLYAAKSVDWGKTWVQEYNPTKSGISSTVHSISFLNENLGFLVGRGNSLGQGCVIRTDDGGSTWADQSANLPDVISNRTFYSATKELSDYMYIGSDNGVFLKFDRVGDAWSYLNDYAGAEHKSYAISAIDNSTVVSVSPLDGSTDYVITTTDGGLNWSPPIVPPYGRPNYVGIDMKGGAGVIVSEQVSMLYKIYKSTDNGYRWYSCYTGTFEDEYDPLVGVSLVDGYIPGTLYGYAAGYDRITGAGKLWYSSAAESHCVWTEITLPPDTEKLTCVKFYNPKVGWVGTVNGNILYTFDGGTTWDKVYGSINSYPVKNIMLIQSSGGGD